MARRYAARMARLPADTTSFIGHPRLFPPVGNGGPAPRNLGLAVGAPHPLVAATARTPSR
jgi:hypothetical protein